MVLLLHVLNIIVFTFVIVIILFGDGLYTLLMKHYYVYIQIIMRITRSTHTLGIIIILHCILQHCLPLLVHQLLSSCQVLD